MFDSPLLLTAFIGVMLASVSTSLLSVPVTMNKVSFMSEAFAHITFSGIALALLFEWNVTAVSLIAVIFFSLLISFLTKNNRSEQVNITMIFLAVSMALSVILLSFNERYTVDLAGYLFGNFLFMTPADLKASAVLIALNTFYLSIFYRWLFYWSYNPKSAQVYGIPVNFVYYTFMVLIAVNVVVTVKSVGVILVTAQMILPGLTALRLVRKIPAAAAVSILISLAAAAAAFLITCYRDLPSGPVLVCVLFAFFLISLPLRPFKAFLRRRFLSFGRPGSRLRT